MSFPRCFAISLVALALASSGCSSDQPKKDDDKKPATTTQATPGDVDMRDYLQGVLLVAWPKDGAGLKAGSWLEIKNTTGGKSSVSRVAVVGEAGPLVKVEERSEGFQGYIEGLTVQKEDGKVVGAVAAKKGEKGKDIKVGPAPLVAAKTSTTSDDSVTVAAGTYAASKTVTPGQLSDATVWVGKDGDAKGILLKEASDETTLRELKSLVAEDLSVGGKPIKALHATYSDGSETWFVRGVVVPFQGQGGDEALWVKQTRGGTTTELSWGDDAKPEIDWTK